MERERSDGRTKLAAEISSEGDVSLLKLRKSILPDVKSKLSTEIPIPISNRRYAYFVFELRLVKLTFSNNDHRHRVVNLFALVIFIKASPISSF